MYSNYDYLFSFVNFAAAHDLEFDQKGFWTKGLVQAVRILKITLNI